MSAKITKHTEEAARRIAAYRPKQDTDYGWVWDYAKYRFEWAERAVERLEEKALAVFKLNTLMAAAAWALFQYLWAQNLPRRAPEEWLAGLGFGLLILAGAAAIVATMPVARMGLQNDDTARLCADHYATSQEALAKMSVAAGASANWELTVARSKSRWVTRALVLTGLSALVLLTALCAGVHRKTESIQIRPATSVAGPAAPAVAGAGAARAK